MIKPGNYIVYKGSNFIAHACPHYKMKWKDRVYDVEWHPYFGPSRLKKNGDPYIRQPGQKHPFWDGIAAWQKNKLKIDKNGNCMFGRYK